MERIFHGLSVKKADLVVLILTSQKISVRTERQGRGIDIWVEPDRQKEALDHVAAYFRENRLRPLPQPDTGLKLSAFHSPAAFVIMVLMMNLHFLFHITGTLREQVLALGDSSLFIAQGETFRAVTALFLHADFRHLLGNLAGILVFAGPFINLTGYGTGPLLLLAAGTSGNLINARFHGNALLSVGASTGVMAAAGFLAAFQVTRPDRARGWRNVFPIFAAATLMAMFSQGENTDVWAHVFGFAAGLAIGLPAFPFLRICRHPLREPVALGLTLAVLAGALAAALASPHFDLHRLVGQSLENTRFYFSYLVKPILFGRIL